MFGRRTKKAQKRQKVFDDIVKDFEVAVTACERKYSTVTAYPNEGEKLYSLYQLKKDILHFIKNKKNAADEVILDAQKDTTLTYFGGYVGLTTLNLFEESSLFEFPGGEYTDIAVAVTGVLSGLMAMRGSRHYHKNPGSLRGVFNKKDFEKFLNDLDHALMPKLERLETVLNNTQNGIKSMSENPTVDLIESTYFKNIIKDFAGKKSTLNKIAERYGIEKQAQRLLGQANNNAPLNKSKSTGIELPKQKRRL